MPPPPSLSVQNPTVIERSKLFHYLFVYTDETDLHVESVDSGSTSAVPSEVVAQPCSDAEDRPPEDEQGLLSLAVIHA